MIVVNLLKFVGAMILPLFAEKDVNDYDDGSVWL
jgi:hypothetical protein